MFHAAWNKPPTRGDAYCVSQTEAERPLISARVEPALAAAFADLARRHDRSVSGELREAMRRALEAERDPREQPEA